ncbi:hypothetical protein SH1V18_02710 [Vallitalea longa]|uniref:Uncharacterized protein n=1 Tax=Vallitalea longa TaxID=2936439 RepID=A0A9W5Y8H6_9FIRM|nr:hypothetical protein [Vallitalea longa]GKX27791.1 hypothetical protein SH1V18_02710 [Vallitalea longa]
MNDKDIFEKTKADLLHLTVKAGLSTIPLAGGALAEIFEAVFASPI